MMKTKYLLKHFLTSSAFSYPDKTALIINNQKIVYRKLHDDTVNVAAYMINKGVQSQDRILIASGNCYLSVIAFWAAQFCNAISCVIDPSASIDSAHKILKKINPVLIFIDSSDKETSEKYFSYESKIVLDEVLTKKFISIERRKSYYKENQTEQSLAMIVHTSGSTGDPKGVMLSHRNVIAAMHSISEYLNLKQDDVILSVLPIHFDYGLYQMLLSFSVGAALILEKNSLFSQRIVKNINQYQVTIVPCVPRLINLLCLATQSSNMQFLSVATVTNTGESLSINYIEKLKKLFPK